MALRRVFETWSDLGMRMTAAASFGTVAAGILGGTGAHWAAMAGGAVAALYLSSDMVRNAALGQVASPLPKRLVETLLETALVAAKDGDNGAWIVHWPQGRVEVMTPKSFEEFRSAMSAEGQPIWTAERAGEEVLVKRWDGGKLQSDDAPAWQVFDTTGRLVRSVDYEAGCYAGEREPEAAAPSP